MPRYVVEREIAEIGDVSEEEVFEASRRALDAMGPLGSKIQWLHSYVTDDKVYCVYIAPDEEAVRRHSELVGLPVDRISAVRGLLDPSDYA
ncbi:MAG: DUF4242 domain-containing protein [Acidobacteriota bacterium]|jgi:hypothetical protein